MRLSPPLTSDPVLTALVMSAEMAGDGLVLLDDAHRCLAASITACTLLGTTEQELCGRDVLEQFPAEERAAIAANLSSCDTGQPYRWSSSVRQAGGSERAVECG